MAAADSRSTHTDALATLGTIIGDGEKRDAIHLGVEPAIAGERLRVGAHVGFNSAGEAVETADDDIVAVGIVDPFLAKNVKRGERFWLIVYPRQITSLRHVWTHPSFPDTIDLPKPVVVDDAKATSQKWIDAYANGLRLDTFELMDAATQYVKHQEYFQQGGRFEGWGVDDEFWKHFEVVTGLKGDGNFFSCSC